MAAQNPQSGAHHQRVGFAAEVSLGASGHLDGGNQRTAGRRDAVFDRAGDVGVGADQLGALQHQVGGLGQGVQRIGAPFADNDIVGVDVVHGDARVIQSVEQAGLADGKDRAARRLLL